jgi:hypothetical protein
MKKLVIGPESNEVPEKDDQWGTALQTPGMGERNFKIQLTVSGGLPAKAYYFSIQLEKNGPMVCRYDSKLDRRKDEKSTKTDDKDVDQLISLLRKTRIFDFKQPPPRFIPDTVVGKLEIYLDDLYHVQYFVADEKQAKSQYVPTHSALADVVDWLYDKGARSLNRKTIKP